MGLLRHFRALSVRVRRGLVAVTALVVVALIGFSVMPNGTVTGADQNHNGSNANQNLSQQLAVPAYINPTGDPGAWSQLALSQTGTVGLVVANVENGPDSQADPAWAAAIDQVHAAGSRVLGYVDTGYLGSPTSADFSGLATRSGLTGVNAWLPQAEADVNKWYQFYGADLGGIFFDEATDTCGPTASSNQYATEYQDLSNYVKQAHPGALTVLNPGTAVPRCYQSSADVLVTFEGSFGDYTGNPVSAMEAYKPLNWTPGDPNKIWHIIYGADQDQMESVMALSKSRNAGYVYVTDDVPANPYDTLPNAAYWSDEHDESYPFGNPSSRQPSAPSGLTAWSHSDNYGQSWIIPSTEVQLNWWPSNNWQRSNNQVAPVVAYDIYENDQFLTSVDVGNNSDVISGLTPSTSYSFTVDARDSAGNVSDPSDLATVTTAPANATPPTAPSDVTVTATSYTTASLTWSPSVPTGEGVANYIVSENGAPVATLPAPATGASVQGLDPGVSDYSFTVQAVGTTGSLSPQSAPVVVSTTPLPDGQAISSPSVQANADSTITYSADFALPFAFRRVFIDTGTSPCWATSTTPAICSDYLIENDQLLKYAGAGTDFTFTLVATIVPTVTNGVDYWWNIPAADIGNPAAQQAAFNGEGYSALTYTAPILQGVLATVAPSTTTTPTTSPVVSTTSSPVETTTTTTTPVPVTTTTDPMATTAPPTTTTTTVATQDPTTTTTTTTTTSTTEADGDS
jgi:hypothetical protein